MAKRKQNKFLLGLFCCLILLILVTPTAFLTSQAKDQELSEDYYTIYTKDCEEVLFIKGGDVFVEDEYISSDNKLYRVVSVNSDNKTGYAEFVEDVKMPVLNIKKNENLTPVSARGAKKIGLYHTHNDECYNDADGTDSVYGAGGIHDVGTKLKGDLESLGITVFYDESLHLPHDSGAYTRSQSTAQNLLNNGLDALFDVHRDATPKSEYLTTVNGEKMSKVRMVIGSANPNYPINKEFALNIKAYADVVYEGLIKDIYIGKGNYNQQLYERALLFEFGTNLIEKELVLKSTLPLAKTIDVVLYGTSGADTSSLSDVDASSAGESIETGLVGSKNITKTTGLSTLLIVLIVVGGISLVLTITLVLSKKARFAIYRFFKEMFARR